MILLRGESSLDNRFLHAAQTGILIQMLLPAIQAARERARQMRYDPYYPFWIDKGKFSGIVHQKSFVRPAHIIDGSPSSRLCGPSRNGPPSFERQPTRYRPALAA